MDELDEAIQAVTKELAETREKLAERERDAFAARRRLAQDELNRAAIYLQSKKAQQRELMEKVEQLRAEKQALAQKVAAVLLR